MVETRKRMVAEINSNPSDREILEKRYGKNNVWNTSELTRDFKVVGFAAPFAVVVRKSDGVEGSVKFQHRPRFYFNFQES